MRSTSLFGRIITSVASLVTLGALAVGVPITLWMLVGWPLPAALPPLHEIAQALKRSDISDATLFKALALVTWIAWLQLAASMLVEAIAWARGRAAPRLPFAGVTQPAMCKLIASAALLLSSTHLPTSTSLTAGMQMRPATTIAVPVEMPTASLVRVDTPAHESVTPRTATLTKPYTVIRYDTLWGIADEHLGNPLRWREIFELNRGKHQPDGRALEDPQLIVPGWELTLPSDATGLAQEAVSHTPVVAPSQPTITHHTPQQHTGSAPEVHTPKTLSNPTHASTTAPTSSTAPEATFVPSATGHERIQHNSERGVDPALLIGGGLAAASLVALLDRLRRAQRRRRRAGRPFAAPRPEVERVERQLRRAADVDEAELLDLALRAFATGATQTGIAPPAILAVRVSAGQVEILSDRPPERLPKGFLATDDARGWITDPELSVDDLRDLGPGAAAPLPALVALGDVDGGRLLIDVESAGTLTVDGDPERVGAFIRRLGVELATSIWADHVDVLAVGTTELDFVGAHRVDHFTDIDAALDELEAAAHAIGDALDSARCGRTLEARISEYPDDGWIPTILVCAEPIEPEGLARLREITGDGGRGAGAVVAASTIHAGWHASLRETKLTLSPLGFHVTPALLDLRTATALDELLTDAAVGEPADALDPQPGAAAGTEGGTTEPYTDPPFEIEVRVLGPVEIVGSRSPLERRRCIELATYLALHPKGASDERLKTVLWPDQAPTTATFNTTVSMTRSGLGRASDGTPLFPHCIATGGMYRLEPLVTTDLTRFEARVAHARRCAPAAAIETLRSALDLVRGKPFERARGYEWAFSEALIANVEATIADAAHQLAQLYLGAGDSQNAIWAALRGLVAAPGDEVLYRDRMLACDLAGNPAGVETVMDELCEVVEALEPYDELHPETLTLYERISHRKRTTREETP
jgi:DNA-binding SARP family transcriptional activator